MASIHSIHKRLDRIEAVLKPVSQPKYQVVIIPVDGKTEIKSGRFLDKNGVLNITISPI